MAGFCIIKNRIMPEFLEFPSYSPPITKYDPMILSYAIAEQCKTCNLKILHPESISVCSCYRYCHQKCLTVQLNNENKNKEELMYGCRTCHKILGVNYKMQVLCKPHLNRVNVFLIIACLILIPLGVYGIVSNQQSFLSVFTISLMQFILLTLLACAIVNSIIVREFSIQSIRSTHLGLMISAFAELEKQFEEQTTQTQMIR